jgi:hypothetical protein
MVITTSKNLKNKSLTIENNLKKLFESINCDFIRSSFNSEIDSPNVYHFKKDELGEYYYNELTLSGSVTDKRIFLDLISGEIIVSDGDNSEFVFSVDVQPDIGFFNINKILNPPKRIGDNLERSYRFELFTNNEVEGLIVDSLVFKEINFLISKKRFLNKKETLINILEGIKNKIQKLLLIFVGASEEVIFKKRSFTNKGMIEVTLDNESTLIDFSLRLGPSLIFQDEFCDFLSAFDISIFEFCDFQNFLFDSISQYSSNYLYYKKFKFYYHSKDDDTWMYYRTLFLGKYISYFINHSNKICIDNCFNYLEKFVLLLKEFSDYDRFGSNGFESDKMEALKFIQKQNPDFYKNLDESFLYKFNNLNQKEKVPFLSRYAKLNNDLKRRFFTDYSYINTEDLLENLSFTFDSDICELLDEMSSLVESKNKSGIKDVNFNIQHQMSSLYKNELKVYCIQGMKTIELTSDLEYSISDLISKVSDCILKLQKYRILPENININITYGSKMLSLQKSKEVDENLIKSVKDCANTLGMEYEECKFNGEDYFSITKNLHGNNFKISASLLS